MLAVQRAQLQRVLRVAQLFGQPLVDVLLLILLGSETVMDCSYGAQLFVPLMLPLLLGRQLLDQSSNHHPPSPSGANCGRSRNVQRCSVWLADRGVG